MRDVEILSSHALIQTTIDVSPAFLEHGSAEKRSRFEHMKTVIQASRRLDSF
jgi:hypothetical protein